MVKRYESDLCIEISFFILFNFDIYDLRV